MDRVLNFSGYTGRLISRYLALHPQREAFTFGLAARSEQKLKALVDELKDAGSRIPTFVTDVSSTDSINRAVQQARVVINTVGPYWRWGTPVVRACVRHRRHYLDLTGEAPWVKDIIVEYVGFCHTHTFPRMITPTGSIMCQPRWGV